MDMSTIQYSDPLFEELLSRVPKDQMRTSSLSFGIASRIIEIMERRGWNQADLAKAMGKKESEISKWLSGQHNFTIQTIARVETVLGEDILSVKKYRNKPIGMYKENDAMKRRWLSEPEGQKYNGE